MIKIPFLNKEFETKAEAISFLKENREKLKSLKKLQNTTSSVKVEYSLESSVQKNESNKSENSAEVAKPEQDIIHVKTVMNTTNYMDSHLDVHIPGIWDKTIKQNRAGFYHLQEHKDKFDHVIAYPEDVKVYTEFRNWSDLGFSYSGQTQCLIFESTIRKDVNPYMFETYSKNRVKNHSVGMLYVQYDLAIKDEDDEKEMAFWNKYIKQVANRETAEEYGFFWVVTEAKLREGSAVLFGSNDATPTLFIEEEKNKEANNSIPTDPAMTNQQEPHEEKKLSSNLLLI